MRRSCLLALVGVAAVALLALAALPAPVAAASSLVATRPNITRNHFDYGGVKGQLYAEPSLFGLPNYQADLQGMLQEPSALDDTNKYGCSEYPANWLPPPNKKGIVPTTIALVVRGGNCTFGQKALRAQAAGASAIIVYNETQTSEPLPKMAGGMDTEAILIPGFLINHDDGVILHVDIAKWQDAMHEPPGKTNVHLNGIWLSLSYSLVAPDDRIEWAIYIIPDETNALPILNSFPPVVESIGDRGLFTPHYNIKDGDFEGEQCEPEDNTQPGACLEANLPCGNQCTNCGKYCRVDPNGDLGVRPDGADAVREAVIQRCLYVWAQEKMTPPLPMLWWNYVQARVALGCNKRQDVEACTDAAMKKAEVPAAALQFIGLQTGGANCMGDVGVESAAFNDILEEEIIFAQDWDPPRSPWLWVNNESYTGSFTCGMPANPATCGPLNMMCQGFLQGTAPSVCNPNSCESGLQRDICGVCGGTATSASDCEKKGKSGSFPVGAFIGVIIVCCVLIGGAVYWYMRRQNSKMRDDIDSLLKQYLPLDGQQSLNNNGGSNGIKSPSHARDPNSNLRLIGNLDAGGDEPTDL